MKIFSRDTAVNFSKIGVIGRKNGKDNRFGAPGNTHGKLLNKRSLVPLNTFVPVLEGNISMDGYGRYSRIVRNLKKYQNISFLSRKNVCISSA